MIGYAQNGVDLFFIRDDGTRVQFGPLDGDKYNQLDVIFEKQLQAKLDNDTNKDHYMTLLSSAQVSVDAGRPANVPAKPQMRVVNDDGTEVMVPFSPVLPDLIMLNVATVTKPEAAQDVTVATFNMVKLIYKKLFPTS